MHCLAGQQELSPRFPLPKILTGAGQTHGRRTVSLQLPSYLKELRFLQYVLKTYL